MSTKTRLRIQSLAKINLDLRVLEKRPDGYHNISTIFQTVSLADTIEFSYTPSRRLKVTIDSACDIPENLIETAAELLAIPGTFDIKLKKKIPMGGGLGGGSSNAASTLLAIPALTGKGVPFERLVELGTQLGSDVPFFLVGGTALAEGRGTELRPLPDFASYPAILVTPPIHVSTPEAYRALKRTTAAPEAASQPAEPTNDFEAVVFTQHRHLKLIKRKLLKLGASLALMSGSGSTVFGIFANLGLRDSAVVSLRKDLGNDTIFPVSLVSRAAYRLLWWRQLRVPAQLRTWPPSNRYA